MSTIGSISFQTVLEYVDALPIDERELLISLIQKRNIESRRAEIAQNAIETREAFLTGRAKRGSVAELFLDK